MVCVERKIPNGWVISPWRENHKKKNRKISNHPGNPLATGRAIQETRSDSCCKQGKYSSFISVTVIYICIISIHNIHIHILTNRNSGRTEFILACHSGLQSITAQKSWKVWSDYTHGQEQKEQTNKTTHVLLTCYSAQFLHPYKVQDPLGNGAAHSRQDLPTSINLIKTVSNR